ncbi:hypothetical protein Q3G72_016280 [Acer saccharum]|nr:hypothetical protein Q3G72_016280 [Acer saccharum]
MQRLDNDANEIIKSNAPKKTPLPSSSIILGESQKATMKKRKMSTSGSGSMSKIEKAFNLQRREQLDAKIARMFYSRGLPFHLSRNPYYRSSYNFATSHSLPGIIKDKFFIANLLKEVINEIGHEKVVQVVTDNVANCKDAGQIIEGCYPAIVWTLCVVHTLNLALKNICAAANTENNYWAYKECNWNTDVAGDVSQIKNFIMNHGMRLAIFNKFVSLKLISVAKTRFASVIVMLKRFKLVKNGLQAMVISDKWSCYREDDVDKANFVKDKILDDFWYHSDQWLNEDPKQVPPHKDPEVSKERVKCFKKYFPNSDKRNKVAIEYASFINRSGKFGECDSITNSYDMDPKTWWLLHGSHAPLLQSIALKRLVQPSSSSCAERNWSIYSFVHSMRRNKMTPQCTKDLVFIHINLRLLSRKSDFYSRGESKM